MNATFTEQEFLDQIVEFRKLMGDKSFWAKSSEAREVAQKALGHAYFFLDGSLSLPVIERCASVYMQTVTEYSRRELLLIRIGGNVGK